MNRKGLLLIHRVKVGPVEQRNKMLINHDFFFDAKAIGGIFTFPIKLACIIEVTGRFERCEDGYDFFYKNELASFDAFLGNTPIHDVTFNAKTVCPFSEFLHNAVLNLTLADMDIDEADLIEELEDEVFE